GHLALPNVDASGAPASLSHEVVTNILRRQLNFDGLIFTDDLDMKALPQNDAREIAVRALQAGNDQLLFCHDIGKAFVARDAITKAIENRVLDVTQIEASLARIHRTKKRFDLTNVAV
ncbi:MAG TPA: glycoside hydrolase family 3 N-terminal domain-containing protein, partial [Abditibacteriaceae bacterium]|nr:glycoside hydrolase family 3 N-terminal domain-containing protein [Abditibacteriaceae bacterium]